MSFKITEFTPARAQAVADMWNNSGDGWGGDMSLHTAQSVLAEVNGGAYTNVYLAEDENGVILGYASLRKYFADGRALYLHVLNVRPEWHGRKVGKALVLACVSRTIELGYPRLDIHTWPGNTKAVPLYKKCGYMWEDRTDSTHLVNFIPTVLKTDASKDFFKTADWYLDNARVIDVKPDGVKENLFELFRYEWKKDGATLAAGFERTGRRMRMLETDAFKITLTAETHEPAFGFDYDCAFEVVNKSEEPLEIKIRGKNDGNISLAFDADERVIGAKIIKARFGVGEIKEPQNIWRVHPCVLADVWINGRHAELGMGIETKWPAELELVERKKMVMPGVKYDAYFNLTNYLNEEVTVSLTLPESASVTRFNPGVSETKIPALGKRSLRVAAESVAYGHEALPVKYRVALPDGRTAEYSRMLHVESRGLTGMCGYEDENAYVIINGPWKWALNKARMSFAWAHNVFDATDDDSPGFPIVHLAPAGGQWSDDLTRAKPYDVKMYRQDEAMIMEASYECETTPGVNYTSILYLTANGILSRRHRLSNTSAKAVTLSMKEEAYTVIGGRTVVPFDGGVQTILDGLTNGVNMIDSDLIDENWLFDEEKRIGVSWPKEYGLNVRWSDGIAFEHNDISLAAGAAFETKPVTCYVGQFSSFSDFRNFIMGTYTNEIPLTTPHIDWPVNGGNPFVVSDIWTAEFKMRRNLTLNGEITFTAGGGKFTDGRLVNPPKEPVSIVSLHMDMDYMDKTWSKVQFAPDNAKPVLVTEEGSVITAANGVITFKADPRYGCGCYSLVKDGREWLMTCYPEHKPYSWMNPFIGGINGELEGLNGAMMVREACVAAPVNEADSFGNVWRGFATNIKVEKYEKLKGVEYTQYFLTLPGLPVMCTFMRLYNKTGAYKRIKLSHEVFLGKTETLGDIILSGVSANGTRYRLRAGAADTGYGADGLARAELRGADEMLYMYRKTQRENGVYFWADKNTANMNSGNYTVEMENGGAYTAAPLFFVFTEKELDKEMLKGLDAVRF
jgi:ribosomal protein S18 acetylase RimI-like enzyme